MAVPGVSVPEPVDHNRNVVLMAIAEGGELSKTRVAEPGWYLDRMLEQVGDERAKGLLERDVGNVLAFFRRKYGVERDVGGRCIPKFTYFSIPSTSLITLQLKPFINYFSSIRS